MNSVSIILIAIALGFPSGGSTTLQPCPTVACTAFEMNNKINQQKCVLPNGVVSCVVTSPWSNRLSYCSPVLAGYKC
jgi:hypothetical protein